MDRLKILSFNAKGLKTEPKRSKVIHWLKEKKCDIIALQESHFIEIDRDRWEASWGGTILASAGEYNKR